MSFDSLFANPKGRTSRGQFLGALVVLLAAAAFYWFLVKGRNGQWVFVTLLFPALMLHAGRLHDMGRSAWWLIAPGALLVAAAAIWLGLVSPGAQVAAATPLAALVVSAAFVLWGALGKGQADANRFGAPA